MRKVTIFEENAISFAGGTTQQLKIGYKDFWITGIDLELRVDKQDGVSPVANQDWLYRLPTTMLLVDGSRKYLSWNGPDWRAPLWDIRMRMRGAARPPDFETGTQTFLWQIPIYFSPDPVVNGRMQKYDPRAAIKPSSGLVMNIGWGAAGTTTTTGALGADIAAQTTGTVILTYHGVVLEPGDPEPAMYPSWYTTQYIPDATHAALRGLLPFDTNMFVRRSGLVFVSGAASSYSDVRNDGYSVVSGSGTKAISEVGLVTAGQSEPLQWKVWDFCRYSQAEDGFVVADDNAGVPGASASYGAAVTKIAYNPGVGRFDYVAEGKAKSASYPNGVDPVFGLNLYGKQATALNMGFTVDNLNSNSTQVQILHEAYQKY